MPHLSLGDHEVVWYPPFLLTPRALHFPPSSLAGADGYNYPSEPTAFAVENDSSMEENAAWFSDACHNDSGIEVDTF